MTRLAALLLLLLATPAWGATYWVAPDSATGGTGSPYRNGADSTAGAFPAGPKTLTWFNQNASAGDVCRFKSGDYGTEGIVTVGSTNGTAAARIRYYGFPNDPGAVRVAKIRLGKASATSLGDYTTVRWVTTTSAFDGIYGWPEGGGFPTDDSLVNCRSVVANDVQFRGVNMTLDSLVLTGSITSLSGDQPSAVVMGGYYSQSGCIINSRSPSYGNRLTNSTFTFTKAGPDRGFKMFYGYALDSSLVYNNTFNLTLTASPDYSFAVGLYNSRHNRFYNNTWTIATSGATYGNSTGFWMLRDYSQRNRFRENTVTLTGSSAFSSMLSNSGACDLSTKENYFGFNTINMPVVQTNKSVCYWQNGIQSDTLEFNTVATSSTAPLVKMATAASNASDRGVIRHNTLLTAGTTAVDISMGTGNYVSGSKFAGNVFYAQAACSSGAEVVKVPIDTDVDSAGVYFSLGGNAAFAIAYGGHAGTPGSGGNYGGTESKWGTPLLADSSYAITDGRVKAGGYAVSTDYHDGYVGVGVSDADVTAPAVSITAPTDTSYAWVASETMALTWTASDAVGVTSIAVDYGSTQVPDTEPTTWTNVTTLAGNVTSYNWVMSGVSTRYGFVRVRGFDAAGNVGSDTQVYRFLPTNPDISEPNRDTAE